MHFYEFLLRSKVSVSAV